MKTIKRLGAAFAALSLVAAAHAAPVTGQGTWETTLQARDLTGDGIADAYYDIDQDITWLRNADLYGQQNWRQAFVSAAFYSIGGIGGWRLASALGADGGYCGGGSQSIGPHCTGTEFGHLWFTALGNPVGGPMTNTGGFDGMKSGYYWLNEEWGPTIWAYYYNTSNGIQDIQQEWVAGWALPVHDGDIGTPLPEPATLALVGAALFGVAATRRRKLTGS